MFDGRISFGVCSLAHRQPHIDRPREPDVSVTLPFADTALDGTIATADHLSEACRQSMVSIISRSHTAIWPVVDTGNFPSSHTLTTCINLYYRHFHTWLPIMDKPAGAMDESAPLLLAAMAAVGATYSRYDWHGLGIALGELVRRAVVYIVSARTVKLTIEGKR